MSPRIRGNVDGEGANEESPERRVQCYEVLRATPCSVHAVELDEEQFESLLACQLSTTTDPIR